MIGPITLLFTGAAFLLLAVATGSLASRYGRSGLFWFLAALCISPVVAIAMLCCMGPDEEAIRKALISAGTHRACPQCREITRFDAVACRHCGQTT